MADGTGTTLDRKLLQAAAAAGGGGLGGGGAGAAAGDTWALHCYRQGVQTSMDPTLCIKPSITKNNSTVMEHAPTVELFVMDLLALMPLLTSVCCADGA